MPSPTDTHQCLPCEQSSTQPSVFDGLCRDYVSQLGRQSLDELHDTTGAVHNDGFRLDQGMLGHVGILTPDTPDGHEDGLDLDDTYQHEDWHRMRLLWVLGAEVDRLRDQIAELEAVTSAEMRQMISEHRQACQELDANRDGLRRLQEAFDELESAHGETLWDLEVADARAEHLAAIARQGLIHRHRSARHNAPIGTCSSCRGDWAAASAVITR